MSSTDNNVNRNPEPANPGAMRIAFVMLVIFIAGLYVFGLLPKMSSSEKLQAQTRQSKTDAVDVVVKVSKMAKSEDILLPATVSAIEETTINSRVTGYIGKRFVDIGDKVKKGQLIAEIVSPDTDIQAEQSKVDEQRANAVVSQSSVDVNRLQAVVQQTHSDMLRQKAAVNQAMSQAQSARAKREQAAASVAQAASNLERANNSYSQQLALLEQSKTQYSQAKATNQRYQNLYRQGFVSQQDAEDRSAAMQTSEAAVRAAEASLRVAQSDVASAKQALSASKASEKSSEADVKSADENVKVMEAAVESARSVEEAAKLNVRVSQKTVDVNRKAFASSQSNTKRFAALRSYQTLLAPFDGVITSRNVDVGSLVSPGTTTILDANSSTPKTGLFGISRTDQLRVVSQVPQSQSAAAKQGVAVEVLFKELPGKPIAGVVSRVSGALDALSRSISVEVIVDNHAGLLRPGMFAQVKFSSEQFAKSVRIPASVLLVGSAGTQVVQVKPDNTLHFITVGIGKDFGKELEISTGLHGGEILVSDPSDDLTEGMKVSAHKAEEESSKPPSGH